MKKYFLILLGCLFCICSFTGCSYDDFYTTKGFEVIAEEDIPEEFKGTGRFYYFEETGIVYVCFDRCAVKLESADYEFYIYDKQKKEFIGYNR